MQLVEGGPDVPYKLIAAHEKGRVVFFCGAGISVPAGLPDFKELAEKISIEYGYDFTNNDEKPLDRVFSTLENDFIGDRDRLLEELWNKLQIKNNDDPQKHYHESLLALSRSKTDGAIRLVTTNFDRMFQKCDSKQNKKPITLVAPHLPIPKPNRWDGIAYLHGLLPAKKINLHSKNDNLVITSGDFGQAYLSERWAARFITELFRNYVVCFVGYSLNDPVMRYLTDAIAKDEEDGIKLPKRYIFVAIKKNWPDDKVDKLKKDWEKRKIDAIYYTETENHEFLLNTLNTWAIR